MTSPLSNELFFEAHRGISGPLSKERGVGLHYSSDLDIAKNLAEAKKQPEDFMFSPKHVTVVHANIPMSSVETDKMKLVNRAVWHPDNLHKNLEQEIPVKPGAPIYVTGKTTIKANAPYDLETGLPVPKRKSSTRKRTYNPPREMKA